MLGRMFLAAMAAVPAFVAATLLGAPAWVLLALIVIAAAPGLLIVGDFVVGAARGKLK